MVDGPQVLLARSLEQHLLFASDPFSPKYHPGTSSTRTMDFAPYQDTAPETGRALSPPPPTLDLRPRRTNLQQTPSGLQHFLLLAISATSREAMAALAVKI